LAQAPEEPEEGLEVDAAAGTFRLDGATYRPGDTVFVMPDTFDQCAAAIEDTRNAVPEFAAKSRHVKVSVIGSWSRGPLTDLMTSLMTLLMGELPVELDLQRLNKAAAVLSLPHCVSGRCQPWAARLRNWPNCVAGQGGQQGQEGGQ
jgi:hypothetical protein